MASKMNQYKIYFDQYKEFESENIKPLMGICGLYFIFLKKTEIPYPFRKSRLIYIGMSEKRTNSIGKRLLGHYDGSSGNEGIEDLESYFILDFVNKYGVYPICNNKSGFEVLKKDLNFYFKIDWKYFEKGGFNNG
jgi:hypothetical protein